MHAPPPPNSGRLPPIGFEGQTSNEQPPVLPPIGFVAPGGNAPPPIGFAGVSDPDNGGNFPKQAVYPSLDEKSEAHVALTAENDDDPSRSPGSFNKWLFFNERDPEGKLMRIDYVLVFKKDQDSRDELRREQYQNNLVEAGLVLEIEEHSCDKSLCFVKVHGPWDVLTTYAELMKMKMPLKTGASSEIDIDGYDTKGVCSRMLSCLPNPFSFKESYYQEDENYFTCQFRKDKMHLFMIKSRDTFFTNAERSRIVYEVLMRTKFDDESKTSIGVRRLINLGVYDSAYPLHEGPYSKDSESDDLMNPGRDNERRLLYELWARPKRWFKFQPLDLIRRYFGEKIAIYFTWLGLYTSMLIPVSIIGLIAFIYGLATVKTYVPATEICNPNGVGNFTICPQCDKVCTYVKLHQSCQYATLSYLFDNPATIFFAVIMSIWGTLFLELWKRREAELQYDWDVATYEEEEAVRPEFEVRCRYVRLNPVTGVEEPYMPGYTKCPKYFISFGLVFFMVFLVVACLIGVIVYRVAMIAVFYSFTISYLKNYAKILTSITAACLNLLVIIILNRVYRILAIYLTNLEVPRTETDYDNNLTLKMYCFQFVNFYASLIYIAFFKGSFVGRPGRYDYNLGYRQEECDPAGCLIELCIQMLIIFLGKQIINNFMELGLPLIFNCLRRRKMQKTRAAATDPCDEENGVVTGKERPQWERDYPLVTIDHLTMFDEYLEMVIQFGFVTLFVSAMPLAPLFALINNIIEIRLDAYKMVTQWRRPFATRAQDIGIWYNILKTVAIISILTNAVIIGYTSDAIPRLVYRYGFSPEGKDSLAGYVNFSLSVFATADFENRTIPDEIPASFGPTVDFCRYRGFREPPTSPEKYQYTRTYWYIFTIRFVFIVIFEHFVLFLTTVIAWLIPDMPEKLKIQMQRERYLAQEVMFKAEEETLKTQLRKRTPRGGREDNSENTNL